MQKREKSPPMQMLFGGSAEPMSELNPDAIDKERSGMECRTMNAAESPIVSWIKEEQTSLLRDEQAGVGYNYSKGTEKGVKWYWDVHDGRSMICGITY